MRLHLIPALVLVLASGRPAATAPAVPRLTPKEVADWRADLELLLHELPARHANAFHAVSRERFTSAVHALERRLPALARYQAIVGLMRVVAMVGDGHTALNPFFVPTGFRRYPVRLYAFEDGIGVRSADSAHADLLGARVVRIGRVSAEAALDSVETVLSHENPWFARRYGADLLGVAEILGALGLVPDMDRAEFELERDGRRWTATLSPEPFEPHGHGGGVPGPPSDWMDASPRGDSLPLWLQQPGRPYWFTWLEDSRTVYICYRAVVNMDHDPNAAFFHRAFATADSLQARQVVLDIRDNSGGEGYYNRFLVREILARPDLDRPDRLFVIIGGRTYSAAQLLVNELAELASATFVGEPTGSPINIYGDAEPLALPRTGLEIFYSRSYWSQNPEDPRDAFTPAWYTPLTLADYRAGRDPALAAVLTPAGPPLADRLVAAAGDPAALAAVIGDARSQEVNRFRNIEAEVNTAGYSLLNGNRVEDAVRVLRANAEAYPRSANAFDSLGDALARAGRRDDAIAAYRQALALDPTFLPSRESLKRLTGS
jgi:Tetratricopeptide repeat